MTEARDLSSPLDAPRQEDVSEKRTASFRPLAVLVGCAFFMEQLDSTIIAPAIPAIAEAFAVEPLRLNLAMTVYLLALVIFVPVSGALADRFGTRTVFRAAIAIFTLSSLFCGFADNLPVLLLARAIQGASAALMVPVGRIAIVRSTRPADLVTAMAWMITPAMIGPLLGPPLGGLAVTYLSWEWIFWINVPIGLLGLYLASSHVPQFRNDQSKALDLKGWLLLSLAVGCLVIGLDLSHNPRYRLDVAPGLLIGGVACVVFYRRYSKNHPSPLLDFTLLNINTFRVALVSGTLVRIGYGALPFVLPLSLQLGLGLSALNSGLAMAGSAFAAMLMKTTTVSILRRFGFRTVLIYNGFLCAFGLAVCATLEPGWSLLSILLILLISGISRSVQFNALGSIAYADTRRDQTGSATSLNTTFQQLAAAFGIAISVWLLDFFALLSGQSTPSVGAFSLTFLVLGFLALLAVPICFSLEEKAGKQLSGNG